MAWTTPGTATAGEVLTASFWNEQVRDNMLELAPFYSAWTDFTPTFSQGVSLTYTKRRCRYIRIGKIVWGQVSVEFTSAGTPGSVLSMNLPAAPAAPVDITDWDVIGSCFYNDDGNRYAGIFIRFANSGAFMQNGGLTNNAAFGATPAVTVASGDDFSARFMYEVA